MSFLFDHPKIAEGYPFLAIIIVCVYCSNANVMRVPGNQHNRISKGSKYLCPARIPRTFPYDLRSAFTILYRSRKLRGCKKPLKPISMVWKLAQYPLTLQQATRSAYLSHLQVAAASMPVSNGTVSYMR